MTQYLDRRELLRVGLLRNGHNYGALGRGALENSLRSPIPLQRVKLAPFATVGRIVPHLYVASYDTRRFREQVFDRFCVVGGRFTVTSQSVHARPCAVPHAQ